MNKSNELKSLNDLAGHWTDRILEMLRAAGVPYLSVEAELAAWQVLRKVLRSELLRQRTIWGLTLLPLRGLMVRVMPQAAEQVLRRIWPHAVTSHFQAQIRRLTGKHRSTPAERELYARITRHPELQSALDGLSGTGFTARLQVAGAGA